MTRFQFDSNAVTKAQMRQFDKRMGIPCARCKKYIWVSSKEGEGWYAIPRIPFEKGGKGPNNCVIVCPKCYLELKLDGTKTIPYRELPYFYGMIWPCIRWDTLTRHHLSLNYRVEWLVLSMEGEYLNIRLTGMRNYGTWIGGALSRCWRSCERRPGYRVIRISSGGLLLPY